MELSDAGHVGRIAEIDAPVNQRVVNGGVLSAEDPRVDGDFSQKESRRLSELRFLGRKVERRPDSSPIGPLRLSRWRPGGAATAAAAGKRRQSAGRKTAPAPPDTDR